MWWVRCTDEWLLPTSQHDEDLRMMRIVGYAGKGQSGGGLLVPERPPTDFQVGFTALICPGHLGKKIGPLR
jgi:hypothetical protein